MSSIGEKLTGATHLKPAEEGGTATLITKTLELFREHTKTHSPAKPATHQRYNQVLAHFERILGKRKFVEAIIVFSEQEGFGGRALRIAPSVPSAIEGFYGGVHMGRTFGPGMPTNPSSSVTLKWARGGWLLFLQEEENMRALTDVRRTVWEAGGRRTVSGFGDQAEAVVGKAGRIDPTSAWETGSFTLA